MKKRSIRHKILRTTISAMVLLTLVTTLVSSWFGTMSTVKTIEQMLTETVEVAAKDMKAQIGIYQTVACEVGAMSAIANPQVPVTTKEAILNQKIEAYGFSRGNVVATNGVSPIDGLDLSDREYFQQSMQGNQWISEPSESKSTGETVVIFSAPIWKDAVPNTEVVGVVYFTKNLDFMIESVKDLKIGKTGITYILDKDGNTIAHPDLQVVAAHENAQALAQSDAGLKGLAKLEAEMTAGKTGFGAYTYHGQKKYLAYAPIDIPNGWSMAIGVQESEFLTSTRQGLLVSTLVALGLLIIFTLRSVYNANQITRPIKQVTGRIQLLAEGDLHSPAQTAQTGDETQVLAEAAARTVESLTSCIGVVSYALQELAAGNLMVEKPNMVFQGDFAQFEHAVDSIQAELQDTIAQIKSCAQQVSDSASQVSGGAQTLSQGASEQAASVEALSSFIQEISHKITQTAENARSAAVLAEEAGSGVTESNEYMRHMIQSMADISQNSAEIEKIIKTIDDIAFQTNILALNAAVEAARAGAAGKGFAVVADEVRNLAGKSADAAKSTNQLIGNAISAVARGTEIAGKTAESLDIVVKKTDAVAHKIQEISTASGHQAESIAEVTQGMGQISAVVQSSSAAAEEFAAASEELSAESQMLQDLVQKFKLEEGAADADRADR